jgi:hypothetical protein
MPRALGFWPAKSALSAGHVCSQTRQIVFLNR